MHLKEDQVKFEKFLSSVFSDKEQKVLMSKFILPADLENITTSRAKLPDLAVLKDELETLKAEFFENKLSDYIDIYRENYAMAKYLWDIKRFIDPKLKRKIYKWVEDFNLVNGVMEEITKKKERFIPVPEDKLIRL